MKKVLVILVALLCFVTTSFACYEPSDYSGSLTSGNGLTGTANWSTCTSFSWDVTYYNQYDLWVYNYTLSVPRKDISHVIVEVSDNFTESNVFTNTPVGSTTSNWSIATADESTPSAPYIPDFIRGIKFEVCNKTLFQFKIVTDRAPVWGDFYAKDGIAKGTWVTVYNTGFGNPDTDPYLNLPTNGSLNFHILRPDSVTGNASTSVPEPATLILMMASIIGLLSRKLKNC